VTSGFVERSCAPWWEVAERVLQRVAQVRFDFGDGIKTHPASSLSQKAALFTRLAAYVNSTDEAVAVKQIEAAAHENGIDSAALVRELVMDADELRELTSTDVLASIGAHTLTHFNLKRLDHDRLVAEIEDSISAVETYVGCRPQTFAYPYGWASAAGEREAQAVASTGMALAVTTQPGVLKSAPANMHLLPRVSLNGFYQEPRLVRALISGVPFLFR
jgi:peptidoglycan/xylan/chitin deacetylase (PgdA/CDA1 family)